MPYLTLDGYTFEVADGSSRRRLSRKGRRKRSYRGQLRDARRGARREHKLRACFKDHDIARAMTSIINGEGHVVFFRGDWVADTGLAPEMLDVSDVRLDLSMSPFTGFEAGSLYGDAADDVLRYDPQFEDEWTVCWWEQEFGGDWHHIAKRSDGKSFVDGVEDEAAWDFKYNWSANVDEEGRVTITGNGGDPTPMHHLCMLPYFAPDELVTTWAAATKPWGGLPVLRMEGDIVATDHEFVVGEVGSIDIIEKPHRDPDFGRINNAQIITFDLVELATTFKADDTVESQGSIDNSVPAELLGGFITSGYLETAEITIASLSEKGAGAPSSPITISGMPITEWGYIINYNPDGDVAWVRTLEGINGISSQWDRCFTAKVITRAGDSAAYFCWSSTADDVEVKDETGAVVTTYNRPPNSGPGVVRWWWGGVTSIDIATGAINWTTILDWDSPVATSGEIDLRPMTLAFGGPNGDELLCGVNMSTQKSSAPIPVPTFGTATHPAIDFARVGGSRVAGPWLVKINTTTGDAISHVANFNDQIASAGTPNRAFVAADRFNIFNIVWNPVTSLWYMSANHSGTATFNVDGVEIGNGGAGSIQTRGTDNFGGNSSVKPYVATFDGDLLPQNVVTLVPTGSLDQGNNRYSYNHSVFLVEDGSGDVLWGWQCMNANIPANLEREGVLGNYSGGPYNATNTQANDSVCVRLDGDLEVVWEQASFDNGDATLGRGHSVQMTAIQNNPDDMLAMISTQGVNANFDVNDTRMFGASPPDAVVFDLRQSFFTRFNMATGLFEDTRELERAATGDKMVAISPVLVPGGPLANKILAAVLMSNDNNVTAQGFYDSAGVRQYVTSDYWNSNGAVYAQSTSGAIHLAAYDADGELDPDSCYPLVSLSTGGFSTNQWALFTVPY